MSKISAVAVRRTVEVGGVVGGDADAVVARVLVRRVPLAVDLIGVAHL